MTIHHLTFLALTAALLLVRITWHVRARVLEPGVAEPSEGGLVPWIRWATFPVWLLLIGAWFVAPERIGWALVDLPDGVRWSGVGVGVVGLALLTWVHLSLDRNFSPKLRIRAEHTLVTAGPYRWVRHPMYTAFLTLMGAFFLVSGHLLLLATGAGMIVAVIWSRTPREEAMMLARFGAEYRAYMARTGALLPRLRRSAAA